MMPTKGRSGMASAFSYFINSCDAFLDFLVQEYSFSRSEPKITPPECRIEYRKDDLVFAVLYEYGDFPWIRITLKGKDNSLHNIIKRNWPEQAINRKKGPSDPDTRVDFVLKKYSDALKEHIEELASKKLVSFKTVGKALVL